MDQEACQATNPLPVLAPPPVALLCSASFFQRCSGTPFLKGHSCPFFKGNLLKKQNQRFAAKGFEPKAAAWAWFLCVCGHGHATKNPCKQTWQPTHHPTNLNM